MNLATFNSEDKALDFMSFLMSHNNQGHQQVSYKLSAENSVEYEFRDVIHDYIYSDVDNYLVENEE